MLILRYRFLAAFAALALPLFAGGVAHAQTWDAEVSNVWSNATNWSGNALPSATTVAAFGTNSFTNAGSTNIQLGANQITLGLLITATNDFSISGAQTLTIERGVTNTAASGTTTINSTVEWGNNITHSNSAVFVYAGNIIGGRALVKNGTGTVVLAGSNVIGNVTLNAGAVRVRNNSGLGAAGGNYDILSGSAFEFEGGITVAEGFRRTGGTGINNQGVLRNISGTNTITGTVTLTNAVLIGSDADRFVFSGATAFTGAFGLSFGGAGDTAVSGVIATVTSLNKTGSGTLFLSGANTFTTATTISNGAVRAANNTALGTVAGGVTVVDGAALEMITNNTGGNITIGAEALNLSGTGIGGAGALRNITGTNTYQGTITNTLASRINSDAGLLTLSGAINATNQLITFGGAGNVTVSGAITNSTNGLTKYGIGTLTLSGVNTYSGTTAVNGGTLAIGVNSAISAGPVIVDSNATLGISTFNDTVGAVTLTDGSITGTTGVLSATSYDLQNGSVSANLGGASAALAKSGSGTVVLSSATNSYGGVTTIGGGVLRVTALANAGTNSSIGTNETITITNSGVLDYAGTTNSAMNRGINLAGGAGAFNVSNSAVAVTNSGVISNTGSFVKAGAGTLILSASNTYTGTTTINAGTLSLSGSGIISTNELDLSASGATLDIANATAANVTVDAISGVSGSTVSLGSKGFTLGGNGFNRNFAGTISGSGGLTKNGASTQTLSGSNTFTGSTLVSAGTLDLAGTTGQALGSTTGVSVSSGATLLLSQSDQINNTATITLSGGTIQRASGVSEVFGNLNLTAASTINFGTGTTGSFAFDSYAPSSLLTLQNFAQGNVLRFNSDLSNFLPSLQGGSFNSSLFSIDNGFTSNWDGTTFTITAIPEPSTVLAAAGLLGLMLWPSRRRILAAAKGLALRA